MGFLRNHQELIHCHYIFWGEILLCIISYVSLLGGTLEIGWKALCRNPLRKKWLEVERGDM